MGKTAFFLFVFFAMFSIRNTALQYENNQFCLYNTTSILFHAPLIAENYKPPSNNHSQSLQTNRYICVILLLLILHRLYSRFHAKQKPSIDTRARTRIYDHAQETQSTPFYKVRNPLIAGFVKRCFYILPQIHFVMIRGPPGLI